MKPTLIALPIVVAVALLISLLRWYRQTRGPRTGHSKDGEVPIKIDGDLPTFNLIALGGQTTGKTVLLASGSHLLTTEMSDGVFRLQTSLDQSVHLTNLYSTLENPKEAWPPGTNLGETRSFTFECVGSTGGNEFPIFNFSYLDYAGELLGGGDASREILDQRESSQKDLEQKIDVAHALFGIIDGQQMLGYLRDDPESRHYIENSITPMIAVMRKVKCPVHFILTKWDLFDGTAESDEATENERLAEVRDKLMSQDQIRNLIEQRRREKRIVRLIPVSAIGRKFAKVDADGHMVKLKDGRLRPINIEVPLCAVLPDLFEQIEDQLDQANEEKIMAERRARSRLTPKESVAALGKFLALPAGVTLRAAADIAIGRSAFSDRVADMFIDWVGCPSMTRCSGWRGGRRRQAAALRNEARPQRGPARVQRSNGRPEAPTARLRPYRREQAVTGESTPGWAFLSARGHQVGYRLLLVPDFIVAAGETGLLVSELRGEVPAHAPPVVANAAGPVSGPLCIVYRTIRATRGDIGAADRPEELSLDRAGRPIVLTYGFVCRGSRVVSPNEEDLRAARAAAVATYQRFRAAEQTFRPETSRQYVVHSAVTPVETAAPGPAAPPPPAPVAAVSGPDTPQSPTPWTPQVLPDSPFGSGPAWTAGHRNSAGSGSGAARARGRFVLALPQTCAAREGAAREGAECRGDGTKQCRAGYYEASLTWEGSCQNAKPSSGFINNRNASVPSHRRVNWWIKAAMSLYWCTLARPSGVHPTG